MSKRLRPNQKLTITQKLEIVDLVKTRKFTYDQLSLKYKCSKQSISDYVRDQQKLRQAASTPGSSKRCRVRKPAFEDLEERLYNEFLKIQKASIPALGSWLQERARILANEMNIVDFKGSNKWLSGFMKRYQLSLQRICGESKKVDEENIQTWIENNKSEIEAFNPADVFNCDETGIFYRCLPNRTVSLKGSKCHGGANSKERVTALLCCNMTGTEKLPLLVIGKSETPRCFPKKPKGSHHPLAKLGCHYRHQAKAWMDRTIFADWLFELDQQFGKQKRKILLLLDNFSCHYVPKLDLKNIQLLYLPANATSLCQPLDQGIIQNLKSIYKRKLIAHYWSELFSPNVNSDVSKIKEVNLLQGIHLLVAAWDFVKPVTIQNCFGHALPGVHQIELEMEEEDSELPPIHPEIIRKLFPVNFSLDDYINSDNDLFTCEEVGNESDHFEEDESNRVDAIESIVQDDSEESLVPPVSHREAMAAINVLLKYSSFGEQACSQTTKFLSNYLDSVTKWHFSELKQKDIRSYFISSHK